MAARKAKHSSPSRRATRTLVRAIDRLLAREYGRRPPASKRPEPLDSLVRTILSQNTSGVNSARAFENLRRRFPSWDSAAQAPVREIAQAIRVGGLANTKAPRIRAILRALRQARGRCDLSHIKRMAPDQAIRFLCQLPGVGVKTAACVVLFSLGKPAFPVDTHVLRVSKRLGLIPQRCTAERAHKLLAPLVPDELKLQLHLNMIAHGRARCRPRNPRCAGCPVAKYCTYFAAGEAR